MLCAMQRTARARKSCPEPDWLQKFKFVSTDRNVPGVVTALSTEGAVTLPEASCFNSARLVASAGECPLHARAIVICSIRAERGVPLKTLLVHEAAHADVHYHPQRKKHKEDR